MAYDDAHLAALLNDANRIAIVGLSRRVESPSYEVAVYQDICIEQTHRRLLKANILKH